MNYGDNGSSDCEEQQHERERCTNRVSLTPAPHSFGATDRTRCDWLAIEPTCQVGHQLVSRVVAFGLLFLQALQTDRLQVLIDYRVDLGGRNWLLANNLFERVHDTGGQERWPAGQQMVQRRTQRVDIGQRACFVALGLFGRHEAGRAQDLAGSGQSAVVISVFGQTEVGDFRLARRIDQHVGRFQVAMHRATAVRISHTLPDGFD